MVASLAALRSSSDQVVVVAAAVVVVGVVAAAYLMEGATFRPHLVMAEEAFHPSAVERVLESAPFQTTHNKIPNNAHFIQQARQCSKLLYKTYTKYNFSKC